MYLGEHIVVAGTEGEYQSWGDVDVALMIEADVVLGCMVGSGCSHLHVHAHASSPLYHLCSQCEGLFMGHAGTHHALGHSLQHGAIHLLLYGIAYGSGQGRVEEHGAVGLQPLCREEGSRSPVPHATYGFAALQRELLCHGVLQLVLHHAHIVSLQIVLVHVHVVFQILIARGGCQ